MASWTPDSLRRLVCAHPAATAVVRRRCCQPEALRLPSSGPAPSRVQAQPEAASGSGPPGPPPADPGGAQPAALTGSLLRLSPARPLIQLEVGRRRLFNFKFLNSGRLTQTLRLKLTRQALSERAREDTHCC